MQHVATAQFTRPSDTTAYAAGDAVANSTTAPAAIVFAVQGDIARLGRVVGARLTKSNTNLTNAAFRLWLFSAAPAPTNDNAALALTFATAGSRLGYIDFATGVAGSDCAVFVGALPNSQPISLVAAQDAADTVWGLLEARGAYTPASAEQFHVALDCAAKP